MAAVKTPPSQYLRCERWTSSRAYRSCSCRSSTSAMANQRTTPAVHGLAPIRHPASVNSAYIGEPVATSWTWMKLTAEFPSLAFGRCHRTISPRFALTRSELGGISDSGWRRFQQGASRIDASRRRVRRRSRPARRCGRGGRSGRTARRVGASLPRQHRTAGRLGVEILSARAG